MFFLKLTEEQANQIEKIGIQALFGGVPKRFKKYTSYVEDVDTGDKYWRIVNLQYDGIKYDVISFLRENFPDIGEYSQEYIDQLITSTE